MLLQLRTLLRHSLTRACPRVRVAHGAFRHPVEDAGVTVYINDSGNTATGAVPDDAVLGFVPPAKGYAEGPERQTPTCQQPTPQGLRDHASFTDTELDRFGLPRLAAMGGDVERWQMLVRGSQVRACATRTGYQDGAPIVVGNLAPSFARHTAYQGAYDFQHTSGVGAWSGWADDAYNHAWNGYYVGMEGYAHIPYPGAAPGTIDLSNKSLATWMGVGGFFGPCGGDQPEMVQGGALSDYTYLTGAYYHLFVENTGNPQNCAAQLISGLSRSPNSGDLMYMIQGCGYVAQSCNYMYVQDQSMAAPNYWGGYTGGWAPSMTSAECVIEAYHPGDYLGYFGTVTFEYCRTTYTRFGVNTEAGIGNIAGGYYRVIQEWDPSYGLDCVTVGNFTDGNNWTFSITRVNNSALNC
jgi:hypothetical protein